LMQLKYKMTIWIDQ